MTIDNPRYSDNERAALERRLQAALADAGLSGSLPPSSVHVTEEGVSLTMNMNEARWFTNQISDLADGTVSVGSNTKQVQKMNQNELTLVFEEVHTVPTGYKPAKVIAKAAA